MENERIERETHYKYDENEKLVGVTIHETITNPICGCEGCDEGALVDDGNIDHLLWPTPE